MSIETTIKAFGRGVAGIVTATAITGQVEAADLGVDLNACFNVGGLRICADTGGYGHRPYQYEPPRTVNRRVATVAQHERCPAGSVGRYNGNLDRYGGREKTCWVEVLKR